MNNIKKIYQHAGKCADQKNLKDILDATMLSTQEEVTYNSPNVPMTSTPVKKNQVLGAENPNAEPRKWILSSVQKNEKGIQK